MAREVDALSVQETVTACVYGLSNSGKTALASAFGGRVVYIAAEAASQRLATWFGEAPPAKVIIPDGNWDPKTAKMDWRRETFALAQRYWSAEGYDVLLWDTWTSTNEELLGLVAVALLAGQPAHQHIAAPFGHGHRLALDVLRRQNLIAI